MADPEVTREEAADWLGEREGYWELAEPTDETRAMRTVVWAYDRIAEEQEAHYAALGARDEARYYVKIGGLREDAMRSCIDRLRDRWIPMEWPNVEGLVWVPGRQGLTEALYEPMTPAEAEVMKR